MAVRNLTAVFVAERKKRITGSRSVSGSSLGRSTEPFLPEGPEIEVSPAARGPVLPPVWVDTVDEIKEDIGKIQTGLAELRRKHAQRKRISFGDDEASKDRQIEILTQSITQKFRGCERNLKKIATIGNEKGKTLPYQERVVRVNVMRSLATSVQALSKDFRKAQKDFLQDMKSIEGKGSDLIPDDEYFNNEPFIDAPPEFTHAQLDELNDRYKRATDRQKEIIRVQQSIVELAEIFRELSILVVEQGTIIDRIDYNVEQALVQVKTGTEDIIVAEKHQKKARTSLCIICLLISIVIAVVIVIFRSSF